jgi:hypothetical protein
MSIAISTMRTTNNDNNNHIYNMKKKLFQRQINDDDKKKITIRYLDRIRRLEAGLVAGLRLSHLAR